MVNLILIRCFYCYYKSIMPIFPLTQKEKTILNVAI